MNVESGPSLAEVIAAISLLKGKINSEEFNALAEAVQAVAPLAV